MTHIMKVIGLDGVGGNGIYRIATVALLAALLSGVAVWLKVGSNTVTRADVSEMIDTESPYVEDKAVVSALGTTVENLTTAVNNLRVEVAELRGVMELRR